MSPKFKLGDTVKVETERLKRIGTVISVEIVEHRRKEHFSYGVEHKFGNTQYLEKYLSLNVY